MTTVRINFYAQDEIGYDRYQTSVSYTINSIVKMSEDIIEQAKQFARDRADQIFANIDVDDVVGIVGMPSGHGEWQPAEFDNNRIELSRGVHTTQEYLIQYYCNEYQFKVQQFFGTLRDAQYAAKAELQKSKSTAHRALAQSEWWANFNVLRISSISNVPVWTEIEQLFQHRVKI